MYISLGMVTCKRIYFMMIKNGNEDIKGVIIIKKSMVAIVPKAARKVSSTGIYLCERLCIVNPSTKREIGFWQY